MSINKRRSMRKILKRWFAASIVGLIMPAHAHHSGAIFDDKSSITLVGTVKQFQWTNPHCWIQIVVPDKSGPVEWSVEMGSPSQLFRGGWKPKSLQVGDKITVIVHPMRDGTNGGLYVSSTRDGSSIASTPVESTKVLPGRQPIVISAQG
jgi:hypothetical protein